MENDSPPHLSLILQFKIKKRKSRPEMGLLNTPQVELIVGERSRSNALVADAFHMLSDVLALMGHYSVMS